MKLHRRIISWWKLWKLKDVQRLDEKGISWRYRKPDITLDAVYEEYKRKYTKYSFAGFIEKVKQHWRII